MTRDTVTAAIRITALVASLAHPGPADAADLHANTASAFERYVRLTETRLDEELRGTRPFLLSDTLAEAQRRDADRMLRSGEIIIRWLETRDTDRRIDIPDGLCHHWIGTVLIPGVTLDRTVALMQAYDTYHTIYQPAVGRSRLLTRDGDRFTVSLQLLMKKVVNVVLNTEYDVKYLHVSPSRVQVRSATTRITEVQHPNTVDEQEKPEGHDNGFLWRFNNYCALDERDAGTYVQCESVSLSRTIPTGLSWLMSSFVTSIPRESLEFTLRAMRTALTPR